MISTTHPARLFWRLVRRARPGKSSERAPPTEASLHQAATLTSTETKLALEQLDKIRDECRKLVTRRASISAGVAVVPIPGVDLGTDIAILLKLLPQINQRFGLSPAQIEGLDAETKRLVMMFIGSVGSVLVGRLITRDLVVKILMKLGVRLTAAGVVKYVPLLGQALSAGISFGAMKLLGNRHIDDCYEVARRTLLEHASPDLVTPTRWEVVP